jgi:ParB family chromosome partitioning protein
MGTKVGKFKEPVWGNELEIEMIPTEELTVIEIQRKPSTYHVQRLKDSIRKVGFVVPVMGIRRNGKVIIIDGQHRFLAAKDLGIEELPVIIVPEKFAFDLMEFNVEKQMSLREKAYVSLNVYKWYLEVDPSKYENDDEIRDSIESIHYVTLGLAYESQPRLFGSAFESLLHRIDNWFSLPLNEAINERKKRADTLLEVESLVRQAVEEIQKLGVNNPFLPRAVVSYVNPIGRRRIIEESYEEIMETMKIRLEKLLENPNQFLSYGYEEEEDL